MIDYSESLIEIDKAMIQYRKAVLKNNLKLALEYADVIESYSQKLIEWTREAYLDGHQSRT
jgi:hypothetical protein